MSLTLRSRRSRAVQRWHYACFRIAANACEERLQEGELYQWDEYNMIWFKWRLALNLYKNGRDLEESWTLLEEVCREEYSSYYPTEYVSAFNLCMAKVCLELYYKTRERHYLKSSYYYNQKGVESMRFDLYAMFKLPEVLQYFGRVMEHYGAFEAAMEVYNKILNNYPNYRGKAVNMIYNGTLFVLTTTDAGYFHVIFRTAVIGKYIAEYSEAQKREAFVAQCCDILAFLLEALPVGLDDVHVVLLYALSLEYSSNASNRFRATGIYQSLFHACSRRWPPIAEAGESDKGLNDFKVWMERPQTWKLLGEYFLELQEELTARDCFKKFTEKVTFSHSSQSQMHIEELGMDVPMLIKIAKNSASIQNFPDATIYAVMALNQNHFDKEVRRLLASWSPEHAKTLLREEVAVLVLEQTWRQRWFLPGYKKRYHEIVVEQYEKMLMQNYFDMHVREKLAYFARDKWRPHFLFESECAKRIQSKIRNCFIVWKWQQPLRVKYSALASESYRKYLRKKYNRSAREEVLSYAMHRFVPKKHVTTKLIPLFALQERSRKAIWRCFKAYKFRLTMAQRVRSTAERKLKQAAVLIQSIARMLGGKVEVKRQKQFLALQHKSAATIQRAFRGRYTSLKYTFKVHMAKKKRQQKLEMMRINYLLGKVWSQKQQVKKENESQRRIAVAYRAYKKFRHFVQNRHAYATRIQRAFRNYKMSGLVGLTRYLIRHRQDVQFSDKTHQLLSGMLFSSGKSADLEGHVYKSPGFRQNTPAYNRTLNQQVIYCNRSFSSDDCVLLGAVLRNPLSRTRRLIFHFVNARNTNWEFDMAPAMGRCRSLRSVSIFGGVWPAPLLCKLLHQVEIENPMIQSFCVESIAELKREEIAAVALSTSKLLLNFFNFSIPGIHSLSLHGMGLIDEDIGEIAKGLAVNTSIQTLCLSLNMIEDRGLTHLVQALTSNRKSILNKLDLSWNFLTLGESVSLLLCV